MSLKDEEIRREKVEYITLEVNAQKLRGMVHFPSGKGSFPAVALFHGGGGQRMESHFIFVKLSRLLAKNKIITARFDFRGSGESEGEFQEMTISQEVEDGMRIMDFLAGHPLVNRKQLGILGLSLGGCIARLVATERDDIKCLVLWSTVADFEELIKQNQTKEKFKEFAREGYIDFGGNRMGKSFLTTLSQVKKLETLSAYQGEVLIVHGTEDQSVPLEHAYKFKKILPSSRLKKIKGADHTYNRVDWEEEVLKETTNFFIENMQKNGLD
ncbi:MAG: alpha/beta hydrolase [Atribacteria sp.]|nr:alpha/beta hydrolase [Candidatus Atribacteria bacterium]